VFHRFRLRLAAEDGMSARQYSERNRQMLRERENGSSLEELAGKYGLRRATVKALLVSERHRRTFEPLQPAARKPR
jgi:Mor family transcriptional regulator